MLILKTELERFPGLGSKGMKGMRKGCKCLYFLLSLILSDCLESQGRQQIFLLSWVRNFLTEGTRVKAQAVSIVGKNEVIEV